MNKDNLRKWVAELRSGKYTQGEGALCTMRSNCKDAHCCLGVVCEVAMENGVELVISEQIGLTAKYKRYGDETEVLPREVREWLGVHSCNPLIGDLKAVTINDSYKLSFDEIADRIEKHFQLNEE